MGALTITAIVILVAAAVNARWIADTINAAIERVYDARYREYVLEELTTALRSTQREVEAEERAWLGSDWRDAVPPGFKLPLKH